MSYYTAHSNNGSISYDDPCFNFSSVSNPDIITYICGWRVYCLEICKVFS